jgi:hypothetical protein
VRPRVLRSLLDSERRLPMKLVSKFRLSSVPVMRARTLAGALAGLALGLAALVGASAAAAPVIAQPAEWMPHDMVIDLQNLPKRYSCDDLWYRFRDLLLKLGARPQMRIFAYRCEAALGDRARSPQVHLQFQLPEALHGKEARWADMRATETTVRLGPGEPASFDASDCELLRQIKDTLLADLSTPVVSYQLPCEAAKASRHFGLSVETLTAQNGSQVRVASNAAH